jgi:hypothetical protein
MFPPTDPSPSAPPKATSFRVGRARQRAHGSIVGERKPPKEKEGRSEQPKGPISQCEKICLHQRTPPRPPPPKQRPLKSDGLGTEHTIVLFILCPMVSRLLTHRFPPPTVHPTPCVISQLTTFTPTRYLPLKNIIPPVRFPIQRS